MKILIVQNSCVDIKILIERFIDNNLPNSLKF